MRRNRSGRFRLRATLRQTAVALAEAVRPAGATSALVLGALLCVTSAAWAQQPTMRRVEFEEAVRVALERNPDMGLARTAIAQAQALVDQAQAFTRPRVSATINTAVLDGARGFSGGVTQPQTQSTFAASASMPLVAATRWADVAAARDQVDVATQSSLEVRRQIALATAETYLTIIASTRQIEVDERSLESSRAHLDYAQKRLEGGAGSRLNQVRAAQAVSADEARLENARLALRRSQEALGLLMAEDGPVDAASVPTLEEPAESSGTAWMANRPDLNARALAIRSAERVLRDAWKAWLPSADATFVPQYVTPSGLFQPSNTWRLIFSVNQLVFDRSQRSAKALKQVSLEQAQFTRTATELRAASEVRTARASVQSYERVLASTRQAATQAADVLRITTAAFEAGATTNLEVIDAQRSARDAETAVTQADDAVRRARLDLLVALGAFPR